MTAVCVEFPNLEEPPIGIWWEHEGEPRFYYAENDRPEAALGKTTMLARDPSCALEDYFTHLADRTPRPISWEKMQLAQNLTPEQHLDMLRRVAISQE